MARERRPRNTGNHSPAMSTETILNEKGDGPDRGTYPASSTEKKEDRRRFGRMNGVKEGPVPCNRRESLLTICINGGVCWKTTLKGVLRCLCQPFFYGRHCELYGDQSTKVPETGTEDVDSKSVIELLDDPVPLPASNDHPLAKDPRIEPTPMAFLERPCSASEKKFKGCKRNEECVVVMLGTSQFKYGCRCVPPFYGGQCNISYVRTSVPTRSTQGDSSLSGLAVVSVVALNLIAILLVLAYIATMGRQDGSRRFLSWRKRIGRSKRERTAGGRRSQLNGNFRGDVATLPRRYNNDFFLAGDPMAGPSDLPKIIFYKSPSSSAGHGHGMHRVEELTRTNNNSDQDLFCACSRDDAVRFHGGNIRSLDDHKRDVIFEEIE